MQQDRDYCGRAPDQGVQEHPQDLPIVAVFCQTDGVADEAARQENELRHGVLPAWIVRVTNRGMTRAHSLPSHLHIYVSLTLCNNEIIGQRSKNQITSRSLLLTMQ